MPGDGGGEVGAEVSGRVNVVVAAAVLLLLLLLHVVVLLLLGLDGAGPHAQDGGDGGGGGRRGHAADGRVVGHRYRGLKLVIQEQLHHTLIKINIMYLFDRVLYCTVLLPPAKTIFSSE